MTFVTCHVGRRQIGRCEIDDNREITAKRIANIIRDNEDVAAQRKILIACRTKQAIVMFSGDYRELTRRCGHALEELSISNSAAFATRHRPFGVDKRFHY